MTTQEEEQEIRSCLTRVVASAKATHASKYGASTYFNMDALTAAAVRAAASVMADLASLENATRPALSLPIELYNRIFEILGPMKNRVAASSVCRHWREVALKNPFLCKSTDEFFKYKSGYIPLLLLLLDRASDPPLDIGYSYTLGLDGDPDEYALAASINRNMHRIRKLWLNFVPRMAYTFFSDTDVSNLEELSLTCAYESDNEVAESLALQQILPGAGRLRSLRIIALRFPKNLRFPNIFSVCPALEHWHLDMRPPTRRAFGKEYSGVRTTVKGSQTVCFHGEEDAVVEMLPGLDRTSDRTVILVNDLAMALSVLGDLDRVDHLWMLSAVDAVTTVLDARQDNRTRIILSHDVDPDVTPPVIFSSDILAHLVSLTVCDYYIQVVDFQPPLAPVLESLTIVLFRRAKEHHRILDDEYPYTWDCPALHTLCLGDHDARSEGPFRVKDTRVSVLLRQTLGFSESRKLQHLTLRNVRLVDSQDPTVELAVVANDDSDAGIADAATVVTRIDIEDDDDWTGRPEWAEKEWTL